MGPVKLVSSIVTLSILGVAGFTFTTVRSRPGVDRVDFGKTITATRPVYDARVAPASDPSIKEFIIPIVHGLAASATILLALLTVVTAR